MNSEVCMGVTKKTAREIAKKILGYIPKEMREEYASYEFDTGMIKLSIFKYIEKYPKQRDYSYFKVHDIASNEFLNYNGPFISSQIFIQNKCKGEIKLDAENLQTIFFEYSKEIDENCLEL